MESNPHAAFPEKPLNGLALLVIPGLGILMNALLFNFLVSDPPILSALVSQIYTWPPSDWRGVAVGIILITVIFCPSCSSLGASSG